MSNFKVPVPVQKARAALAEKGLEITVENIEKHLDSKEVNRLMTCMRTKLGQPEAAESQKEFKTCATNKAKKEFLVAFLIEPELGKCAITNKSARKTTSGTQGKVVWLTLAQMASSQYWCNMEDALLIAKDCPERVHPSPAMAAEGKKQYQVELTEEIWANLHEGTAETSNTAELKADEYKKITAELESNNNKATRKRVAEVQLTPEMIAKKEADDAKKKAIAAFGLALSALKRSADKARSTMSKAIEVAASLKNKGYPPEMVDHFEKHFKPVSDFAVHALDEWTEASKSDLTRLSRADIEEFRTVKVEPLASDVEAKLKNVESVRKEVAKIAK